MGFGEFVKDTLTVLSYNLLGFLILLMGIMLILSNSFLNLGLSEEIKTVLSIIGFVLIIIGGLFVRYTSKRVEKRYDV